MDQADNTAACETSASRYELMRATPAGRRLGAILLALLLVGIAAFALLIVPRMESAFAPLPSGDSIQMLKTGFALFALAVVALALTLAANGWRIVRSGQAPPPGTLVWRDTRIIRGLPARRTGIAYLALGVLCCALGIGLGVHIWGLLNRLTEPMAINLPPGVVILKQTFPPAR